MNAPASSDPTGVATSVHRALSREDRIRGALWGLFVGDALAMPVHWYYDVAALERDFGIVRDYHAPRAHHPNSIMPLASTGSAGRGSQDGDVVGRVILKGRKHLWGTPNRHYHHGLHAGDNTLNLLLVRVLIRTMIRPESSEGYDADAFLAAYVDFLTSPDSHDDTYAESVHRDFFARWARGIPPRECAGEEGHDTASIGGLVGLAPVVFAALHDGSAPAAIRTAIAHLRLTHRSGELERHAREFVELLLALVNADPPPLEDLACAAAERLGFPARTVLDRVRRTRASDLTVIGGTLSPACYIDQSFPAVLYLAARYAADFESALIANTNAGGDNCHRGAVLGALLGAALGQAAIPARWIEGLSARAGIDAEIERFVARYASD